MVSLHRKFLQAGCVIGFVILLAINAKPIQKSIIEVEPQLTAGAAKLPIIDWRETEIIVSEPTPQIIETAQLQEELPQPQEELPQPVVEEIQDTEPLEEVKPNIPRLYDFNLLALTVQAEGYTMGYTGMRYITSSIINLARDRGCSIDDVITSGAYTVVNNGTIWRQEALYDETIEAVFQEVYIDQIDTEIKYFRTDHFHSFGTPCFNYGNVYFSK